MVCEDSIRPKQLQITKKPTAATKKPTSQTTKKPINNNSNITDFFSFLESFIS